MRRNFAPCPDGMQPRRFRMQATTDNSLNACVSRFSALDRVVARLALADALRRRSPLLEPKLSSASKRAQDKFVRSLSAKHSVVQPKWFSATPPFQSGATNSPLSKKTTVYETALMLSFTTPASRSLHKAEATAIS
eukprot:GFKZ01015310.1.p1 GENE.GFKZ01015310.1~~GFKZ01015310.1.p1  ORF type:complete len:136 (+),score=5.52 GFKZ01015310.1:2191-2598(+)